MTVIEPITGKFIAKCKKLAKEPETREVWTTAFGKEWGNLEQVYHKTITKGTNSLFVLDQKELNGSLNTARLHMPKSW